MANGQSAQNQLASLLSQARQPVKLSADKSNFRQRENEGTFLGLTPRELSQAASVAQKTAQGGPGSGVVQGLSNLTQGFAGAQQTQNRDAAADEFNRFIKESPDDVSMTEVSDKAMEIGQKYGVRGLQKKAQEIRSRVSQARENALERRKSRLDATQTLSQVRSEQADRQQQQRTIALETARSLREMSQQAQERANDIIENEKQLQSELDRAGLSARDMFFTGGSMGEVRNEFQKKTGKTLSEVMSEDAQERLAQTRQRANEMSSRANSILRRFGEFDQEGLQGRNRGQNTGETELDGGPAILENIGQQSDRAGEEDTQLGPTRERAEERFGSEEAQDGQRGGEADEGEESDSLFTEENINQGVEAIESGGVTVGQAVNSIRNNEGIPEEEKQRVINEVMRRTSEDVSGVPNEFVSEAENQLPGGRDFVEEASGDIAGLEKEVSRLERLGASGGATVDELSEIQSIIVERANAIGQQFGEQAGNLVLDFYGERFTNALRNNTGISRNQVNTEEIQEQLNTSEVTADKIFPASVSPGRGQDQDIIQREQQEARQNAIGGL